MDGSTHDVPFDSYEPDILERPSLGMIGRSVAMTELRRTITQFAPLPAPVLVTGETGSGKELVARALHDASPRAKGPFIALNAGALPATLIASVLYGHERGSFTGATHRHRGAFEQAHGGTLFLDEVAELARDLQAWLLRVLESGEVRPLGSERSRKVDVRLVTATNVDLERAVQRRRFRGDLYWRLAVLPVRSPALRDRTDDIPMLVEHFLTGFGLDEPRRLGADAIQALQLHDWPGNVRELRAVLLRAIARSPRITLDATDIVGALGPALTARTAPNERDITVAMLGARGNVAEAARRLGMKRTTLRDRLLRTSLTPPPAPN